MIPRLYDVDEGEVLIETQKKTGMVFQMGNQRRASLSFKEAIDFVRNENPIGKLKWAKCWYMANRASIGTGKVVNVPEWLDWELWQGPAPRENYRDNIVHYNWHWFRNWGTAETGNNAPHFADAARWALEVDYPEEIQTMSQTLFHRGDDYQFPDTFNSSFRFPGGKFITFELSSRANGNPFMNASTGALVYGEKGSLYLSPGDSATVFDEKSKVIKTWKPGGSTQVGSLTNPTAELDFRHMTKFVECIRAKDVRTNAPVEEAVKSTFMPLVANIAGEIGETVRLDPKTVKLLTKAAEKLWSREYAKGWEALV
jgi:predicted dehydrogenase